MATVTSQPVDDGWGWSSLAVCSAWLFAGPPAIQRHIKELVIREPLTENDLLDLARRRAEAIVVHFKTTAGLDIMRVSLGSSGPVEETSTEIVNTRLTLDVIKPSA